VTGAGPAGVQGAEFRAPPVEPGAGERFVAALVHHVVDLRQNAYRAVIARALAGGRNRKL